MALQTSIAVTVIGKQTETRDLVNPAATLERVVTQALSSGAGLNQADRMFSDIRTIGATTNDDLDLAGSLTDAFGVTVTFARLKMIFVQNPATNTGNVEIGGATNPMVGYVGDATDKILIPPGGFALLVAPTATGWAVTATTGDILRIRNAGSTSQDIPVILIGAAT